MAHELSVQKAHISELETRSKCLTQRGTAFSYTTGELSKSFAKMNECLEFSYKKASLEMQHLAEKENIAKREQYAEEINQKELQMRRQLSSQQEKIDKLNFQQSQKRSVIEDSLKSLREEYEAISKERNAVQEKININERCIKETENNVKILYNTVLPI